MKYKDILKEIERHRWWSEEAPAVIQTIFYPLNAFVTQSKVLHPKRLSITILIYKNHYFYEKTSEEEKYDVYLYVFKKMKKNKNYLKVLIKDTERKSKLYSKEFFNFVENKKRMSNKELCDSYTNFMNKYTEYLKYPAGIECIDILTAYYLKDMLKKGIPNMPSSELQDILFILTSPKKLSFIEEERISFLSICLANYDDIKNNKLTNNLKKQLDNHSRKYFYVLSNYKDARFLDSNYFLIKSKEETKKDKLILQKELYSLKNKIKRLKKQEQGIYKKYDFSDNLKLHLKITKIMGESIDNRKSMMIKTNNYIEMYCKEIAKRFNIELWDIKDYTFDEIRGLLLHNKKADKRLLQKRKKISAYIITRKNKHDVQTQWFYGKKAENIFKKTSLQIKKQEYIKGQVANAPVKKIKGKVQVILDVSKQEFKEGNILVATMTRPEFVPLMRKAAAVITDEGGMTCHAAIVSREMRLPCIVGTKIATKVLKDGMSVEVNANHGWVRILKK